MRKATQEEIEAPTAKHDSDYCAMLSERDEFRTSAINAGLRAGDLAETIET